MGLLETSLEVVNLAAKVANPELVQAATQANIEALQLTAKNLEMQKKMRGNMGTDGTDPNFRAAKLGERPVRPYISPSRLSIA